MARKARRARPPRATKAEVIRRIKKTVHRARGAGRSIEISRITADISFILRGHPPPRSHRLDDCRKRLGQYLAQGFLTLFTRHRSFLLYLNSLKSPDDPMRFPCHKRLGCMDSKPVVWEHLVCKTA